VNTEFGKLDWAPFRHWSELTVRAVLEPGGAQERLEAMRASIEGIAPGTRVETSEGWLQALLLSIRGRPADLLLLDLAAYKPLPPALLNHLRQLAEADALRVFGNIGHPAPGLPCAVLPWSELDDILRAWFSTRTHKQSVRAAQASA
jgi:hypothetical protein